MRLRTPLTLLALVIVCGVGVVLGWRLLTQDAPPLDAGSPRPGCSDRHLPSGSKLRAAQIQINVYNAGSISGLANTTMRSLSRRGFVSGVVDNAPAKAKAQNVLVLDPEPKSASVELVASQFKGDVAIRKRADDLADGVDIIVGDDFQGVDPTAKTSLSVRTSTRVCVPTATAR